MSLKTYKTGVEFFFTKSLNHMQTLQSVQVHFVIVISELRFKWNMSWNVHYTFSDSELFNVQLQVSDE